MSSFAAFQFAHPIDTRASAKGARLGAARFYVLAILALVFCAIPAHATITFVQAAQNYASDGSHGVTTLTATFASNNTTGCMLYVAAGTLNHFNAPSLNTPTDSAGDTFLPLNAYWEDNDAYYVQSWYVPSCIGGGKTVTITGLGGYGYNMVAGEYHHDSPITLDQQGVWPCGGTSNSGTANVVSTPPLFTSTAAEIAIGWLYDGRELATVSASNSYTIRAQGGGGTGYDGTMALADRSVSVRGEYTTTFSGMGSSALYGGATSFSEGGSVLVPAIQQLACGDATEPWHELGVFSGNDIVLAASKSGDYIFVAYRCRDDVAITPTISDTNSYTWTPLQTASNYALWYAVVPSDEAAGDIISFGNISYDNASRLVELHGLSGLPAYASSSGDSTTMSLSLSGYTTPAYSTGSGAEQWYGTIANMRGLLSDFLNFADNDASWPANVIPGATPSPGHAGTDLFPTDLSYLEFWLPGAPVKIRHFSQVY